MLSRFRVQLPNSLSNLSNDLAKRRKTLSEIQTDSSNMSDSQQTTSPTSESEFFHRSGYDDRGNTSRANIQRQRQKINHDISREMKIRAGAEKMLKATSTGLSPGATRHESSAKLQEMIALELGVVNSRLQLLSEQLAEINSQVTKYQNVEQCIPMIPIGLKETVDVSDDFTRIIKALVQKHFYVSNVDNNNAAAGTSSLDSRNSTAEVEQTMNEFHGLREACRKPMRDENGIRMLYEYFNQLCLIERRFFAGNVDEMIEFQWYDSLTGIPFSQKSLAFEKGSTLFNIAALHTQIGAAQNRLTLAGLAAAAEHFCRAAGLFEYIAKSFKYAPSMDLRNATLDSFKELMLAQAHECLHGQMVLKYVGENDGEDAVAVSGNLKAELDNADNDASTTDKPDSSMEARLVAVAQQASRVQHAYASVRDSVITTIVKEYFPSSWISLILVKMQHYKSLGHFYFGQTVLLAMEEQQNMNSNVPAVLLDAVESHSMGEAETPLQFARSHFRQATLLEEEAIRTHEMCKHLRQVDLLFDFLRRSHELALNALCDSERENDLSDPVPTSAIIPSAALVATKVAHNRTVSNSTTASSSMAHSSSLSAVGRSALATGVVDCLYPSFSRYKVRDLFATTLGPLAFFNCLNNWSPPKEVRLQRDANRGFGFSIRGSAPVSISDVERGSVAQAASLQVGDLIIEVNGQDARSALHEEVVEQIRASGQRLRLQTITMTRTSQATTATLSRRIAKQDKAVNRRQKLSQLGGA